VDLRRGHHRLCLGVEALSREPAEVCDAAVLTAESERNMLSPGKRCGEAIQPRLGRFRSGYLCQQKKVTPPVCRVMRAADDDVLDLRPAKPQQGEVGLVTERGQLHGNAL
jgi:hypothetical protein